MRTSIVMLSILVSGVSQSFGGTDLLLRPRDIQWSSDGRRVVVATDSGFDVFSTDGSRAGHSDFDTREGSVAISPDGKWAVILKNDRGVWIVDLATSAQRQILAAGGESRVYSRPNWSQDGAHLTVDVTEIGQSSTGPGRNPIKTDVYLFRTAGGFEKVLVSFLAK